MKVKKTLQRGLNHDRRNEKPIWEHIPLNGLDPRTKDLTGKRINHLKVLYSTRVEKSERWWWVCKCDCGMYALRPNWQLIGKYQCKSCGCRMGKSKDKRAGTENHPLFGGHRTYTSEGYVLKFAPNHPKAKDRRVLEHRLVMEEHIGRTLTSDETVHHKNGIRDDNRIENLELWTGSHPYGVRKNDLTDWAISYLQNEGYRIMNDRL